MLGRSRAVGDQQLILRQLFDLLGGAAARQVDRALDMLGFVGRAVAGIDDDGLAAIDRLFRVGDGDPRRVVGANVQDLVIGADRVVRVRRRGVLLQIASRQDDRSEQRGNQCAEQVA